MPRIHLQIGSAIVALLALTGAGSVRRCEELPGWQQARDQKPVRSLEALPNQVVQLGDDDWSWNGDRISEETFFEYLAQVAKLEPQPVTLVKFADGADCAKVRALKVRIAALTGCAEDWPFCLEGTNAEYVAARFGR